jgi:NADPH2:quinone reductase
MAQAVRIHKTGGTEVLTFEDVDIARPGAGEVLVRQTAIGINFIDIYHRTGLYPLPSYPAGLGLEAAGVVEQVGEGVNTFKPGDRVAYCGGATGAYATYRVLPASLLVKIPENVSDETAAAVMLKGLTAHYLLRNTFRIQKGDTIVIHAAAGGVGLLVCQWAKYLGATVIGTVSTNAKAALAQQHGCDHAIIYTRDNVPQRVKEITQGKGADVVYDSVGRTTFMDSLDCLAKFGMLVSFGQSSGPIPPFDISVLSQKGSLYLSRPTLFHHMADPKEYAANASELFALVEQNMLKVFIGDTYGLKDVAKAQSDLEGRKTTGALVLTV